MGVTRMKRIDTYGMPLGSFWWNRIQRALDDRKPQELDWDKNLMMANSADFKVEGVDDVDSVWQNIILANLRWIIPTLCPKNPEFTATPLRKDDERTYQLAAINMNRAAKVTDLEEEVRMWVQYALLTGHGYIKNGWQTEKIDVDHEFDDQGQDQWQDNSDVEPFSTVKPELTTIGIGSGPFSIAISTWNTVRSPGSTSIRNAAWFAERIFVRLEDAKRDKSLKHRDQLESNATPKEYNYPTGTKIIAPNKSQSQTTPGRALADPGDQLVELWEIWDVRNNQVTVISPGVDDELKLTGWPSQNLRRIYPYTELQFLRICDQPYSLSHISSFRGLVVAKNKLEAFKLLDAKTSVKRHIYNTEQVDPETLEQLKQGDIGSITGVNGDVKTAVGTWGGGEVSPNLQYADQSLQNGIDQMSNQQDFERGTESAGTKVATVATYKQQSEGVRLDDMKRQVERALGRWAFVQDRLHKEFLDEITEVRVAGADGFEWKQYHKMDLTGQYEYALVPGSLHPLNVSEQRQLWVNLINVLSPLFAPGTNLNGREVVKELLRAFPITDVSKILGEMPDVPPADPEEENWFILQGGNPPVSMRENFQQHLVAHQQALLVLQQQPDADQDAIARLQEHMQATQEMAVKAMMQQQAQAMMQAQMQQQLAAGAEGIQRGPGNGGPARGGPARPRMFAESRPSEAHQRGAQQRGPRGPGPGPGPQPPPVAPQGGPA